MENMRKPGSERAAQHPLQNSLPSKQSLKRKNSWDLDEVPVSVPDESAITTGLLIISELGLCGNKWATQLGDAALCVGGPPPFTAYMSGTLLSHQVPASIISRSIRLLWLRLICLALTQGLQGAFLPGDSSMPGFSSNPDQFSRLPGGMRVVRLPAPAPLCLVGGSLLAGELRTCELICQAGSAGLVLAPKPAAT